MAYQGNQQATSFPTVPSSLSADNHGMRDYYTTQEQTATRNNVHSLEDLTPYLGLRARLSQVWINRWTILILLVLARVLIAIGNLHDDIDAAEAKALSACTSVEAMGSTVASMPHYLSQGTNELAARGVTKAVNGLEEMLFMTITGVEEIFVFVVNMMYGTYECLITFAVTGAAHVAVQIAEDVTKFLNDTLGNIEGDISKGVTSFQNDFNGFLSALSSIPSVFGGSASPPKLDLTSQLDELNNIKLPDSINEGLNQLNGSIPTFDEVQNFTNYVLRLPFEEVKTLLNSSLGNYTFNQSIFPVAAKQSLSFCQDNDGITDFFDSLYNIADIARKVFIAVLVLAAIIACIPTALLEIRRWRKMQDRARLITSDVHEPLDVIYIVSRPFTAATGLKISRNFSSPRRQTLTRWFVAYITSTPALLVLAIALAGLFSALCQYILLQAISKEVPALATQVGAFADKVVVALNNASSTWANGTNAAIIAENNRINDDVFGWVNTTTHALNDTLNTFINETTGVLQKAFNGTILEDPVMQVFNCLIGLKAQKIEEGLTWVSDNAHIDFPLFPDDVFSAGASKALNASDDSTGTNASGDSFLAAPDSSATDAITAAVVDLVDKLRDGIRTEALIATGILMVYVIVVLMGFARILWRMARRGQLRGNGGVSYAGDIDTSNMAQQPVGHTAFVMADRPGKASPAPAYEERGNHAFTSFEEPLGNQYTGYTTKSNARSIQTQGVVGEYGETNDVHDEKKGWHDI
jgi:hypothetical protein